MSAATSNAVNDCRHLGQRVLSLAEVCVKTGLSRSTIYELINSGDFPAPIKLTARRSAWLLSEVDAWLDAKLAERDAASSGGARL